MKKIKLTKQNKLEAARMNYIFSKHPDLMYAYEPDYFEDIYISQLFETIKDFKIATGGDVKSLSNVMALLKVKKYKIPINHVKSILSYNFDFYILDFMLTKPVKKPRKSEKQYTMDDKMLEDPNFSIENLFEK